MFVRQPPRGRWIISGFTIVAAWGLAVSGDQLRAGDLEEMASRVDARIAERWKQEHVQPEPLAGDANFMRRAYLDLTGVIPSVGEARRFLNDRNANKRAALIEELLARPAYAMHMANTWRAFLLPQNFDAQRFGGGQLFERWLADKFADNASYDTIVRELILAGGQFNQSGPVLYYTALEAKPDELAASTSRAFLGVQIQCAQCHNHPFDHWTQRDFWGYAAFFARIQRPANQQAFVSQISDASSGEVEFPTSGEVIPPTYLRGAEAQETAGRTRREQLAQWMTAPENPYFARAAANRIWALLFGRGLVEPVDDLGDHNPASHPELLAELAAYFTATNYDVRNFIRMLTLTHSYQRASTSLPDSTDQPENFARMAIKNLTAEQLYDSLAQATARRQGATNGQFYGPATQMRQAFLNKFRAAGGSITEYQNGVAQALTLMNGSDVRSATDLEQSDLLGALTAPFFSDQQRVETLFLATLSRLPDAQERVQFLAYVEQENTLTEKRKALGDILWALLNSAEFSLNH